MGNFCRAVLDWAIAELNALIVLDGTKVKFGPPFNPVTEEARDLGVIIAAGEPIACDRVGIDILKHLAAPSGYDSTPLQELKRLTAATERGVGVSSPEQVELITDGLDGAQQAEADDLRQEVLRWWYE